MTEKLNNSAPLPWQRSHEQNPITPEQKEALYRFLSEKQWVLSDTTQKLHGKPVAWGQKTDYYAMAALLHPQKQEKSIVWPSLNISESHISADGVLKNISGKTTINSIFQTPGTPKTLTLQIPKTIVEWRGVAKDTPHDIHWDETKKSYIYSSGPAQWLRPFIKDGMILRLKESSPVGPTPAKTPEITTTLGSDFTLEKIGQLSALNESEKKLCIDLFTTLEETGITKDTLQKLWQQISVDIRDGSSEVFGYTNITDSNFISVIQKFFKTVLSDKTIPEKTKISLENIAKNSSFAGAINVDQIIHTDSSEERFLSKEKIVIAENKNKKILEWQPHLKEFVWEYLPKYLGYTGEMSYKQFSVLIAQLQTNNSISPVDGYIKDGTSPINKLLLQACSMAKIGTIWNKWQIWGNNYLPHGVKFVAPLSQKEKEALRASLPEGKNLDDGINDLSYQCASFLTYMNGGISGNAWTMPEFIIQEWWQEIANSLRNCDWSKLPTPPSTEQIQSQIQAEIKSHPIDIKQIKVGDVITMMHPKSKFQERAFQEWLTTSARIVSTHVWQVTELNGKLYVTHNIHGTIFTEPLSSIISGKSLEWDIATGVFRLNSGDTWSAQFQREKDRLGRKAQKKWGGIMAMIP